MIEKVGDGATVIGQSRKNLSSIVQLLTVLDGPFQNGAKSNELVNTLQLDESLSNEKFINQVEQIIDENSWTDDLDNQKSCYELTGKDKPCQNCTSTIGTTYTHVGENFGCFKTLKQLDNGKTIAFIRIMKFLFNNKKFFEFLEHDSLQFHTSNENFQKNLNNYLHILKSILNEQQIQLLFKINITKFKLKYDYRLILLSLGAIIDNILLLQTKGKINITVENTNSKLFIRFYFLGEYEKEISSNVINLINQGKSKNIYFIIPIESEEIISTDSDREKILSMNEYDIKNLYEFTYNYFWQQLDIIFMGGPINYTTVNSLLEVITRNLMIFQSILLSKINNKQYKPFDFIPNSERLTTLLSNSNKDELSDLNSIVNIILNEVNKSFLLSKNLEDRSNRDKLKKQLSELNQCKILLKNGMI